MQLVNECFEIVKKDYLKFLNKEKIYKKSIAIHVKSLKKIFLVFDQISDFFGQDQTRPH